MSTFFGLAFLQPWALLGLLALPAIWWLLRFVPPRPRRVAFPPTRILAELQREEDTRATTPWWLVLLRLVIAALIVLALARPTLDPPPSAGTGSGTMLILVDDGWASGPHWPAIGREAETLLAAASEAGRPVILAATASDAVLPSPDAAERLRERVAALQPQPHPPARERLAEGIEAAVRDGGVDEIFWLADGIDHGGDAAFAARLGALLPGGVNVRVPRAADLPRAIGAVRGDGADLRIGVLRAVPTGPAAMTAVAYDMKGREIARAGAAFEGDGLEAEAVVDLPRDLRNEIARVALAGEPQAGAVELLDDRWRRPVIGLVSGEARDRAQPLLSPLHYVERALAPYADLRPAPGANIQEGIAGLMEARVSMMILTDVGTLIGGARDSLAGWVDEGGVLVRFAGPRLAGGEEDDLLPVELRRGGRELGGTLSWSEPQALAPFEERSPFAGLEVPDEVRVERQILAEPSAELADRTWATLADGTPLVTARRQGEGWIVLFHVTADPEWSNLPMSGTFVEMLRRLEELSRPVSAAEADADAAATPAGETSAAVLRPFRTLDAAGRLGEPPASARAVPQSEIDRARPEPDHPPGWYGEPEAFRAINLVADAGEFAVLDTAGLAAAAYPAREPRTLAPWLLTAALVLFLVDGFVVLAMTGQAGRLRPTAAALLAAALLLPLGAGSARAQDAETSFDMAASLQTRLAFVRTGNPEIDRTSEAGLMGLSEMLAARTALEPGEPMGVDPESDELAFFPLLYWPVDHDGALPSEAAMAKVDAYMKQGGTVLFDTRDTVLTNGTGTGPGMLRLREMLSGLDMPELEPVPVDHVLTKTFYLVQNFPGRWSDGAMWVEASLRDDTDRGRPVRAGDGVSPVLITSNDLAGAWAIDARGQPLYPVVPDGNWQREMSYRAGINIVMYTLTGNYKADQVHLPALLERLGQ